MDREAAKKLLYDVISAIDAIDEYVGNPKIYEEYNHNPLVQDAVE